MIAAVAASVWCAPATADVKAGVDAYERGEYRAAVETWRPFAIAGDAEAQYNLGQAYKLGRGVPVDPKMAEDWYRKAADQGLLKARDAYGLQLFQNGNRAGAMDYIEESAGRGVREAQYVYATALFNGDLVEKDWVRAYALMTRASAAGVDAASASLAQMDRFIPLEQRQRGLKLARAFELAADKPGPPPSAAIRPITPEPLPPSKVVAARPAPVVKPIVVPVKAVATPAPSGNWKVQLGAFANPAGANALWGTLHKRLPVLGPYRNYLVPAGAVTRLQAGPLPSRAAAEALCASVKASKAACVLIAP
ncbi:MAG: SPOR domain-containing protein [Sphingomonadaceae bacterium]